MIAEKKVKENLDGTFFSCGNGSGTDIIFNPSSRKNWVRLRFLRKLSSDPFKIFGSGSATLSTRRTRGGPQAVSQPIINRDVLDLMPFMQIGESTSTVGNAFLNPNSMGGGGGGQNLPCNAKFKSSRVCTIIILL